ncbi:MAG: UrcA family protein [Brevundimonas sp.]|uniref:UrcA family protein n=1 Tax=Brevundimonas sp. TaxID=1871086 RepID=UPI0027332D40|nr:UrcA family protein [Brevundimonas sp.]MDP3403582.1 UrcA family protein [Brevundimonas sp.]
MKPAVIIPALLATLTLACAGTASAEPQRLAYGDLDLSSAAGARTLDVRIARIARTLCNHHIGLDQAHCERGIRQEALATLPAPARTEYVATRQYRASARVQASTS